MPRHAAADRPVPARPAAGQLWAAPVAAVAGDATTDQDWSRPAGPTAGHTAGPSTADRGWPAPGAPDAAPDWSALASSAPSWPAAAPRARHAAAAEPLDFAALPRSARAEPRPGTRRARRRGHGRAIAFAAAAVPVLIVVGGVLVLLGRATPASHPSSHRQPAAQLTGPAPPAARPVTAARLITVAPAAALSPSHRSVVAFLRDYFTAINSHDYAAYRRLFATALRGGLSPAAFATGYGSSTDSRAIVRRISARPTGQLRVTVSFVSHQLPAASATHTSCTSWTIALFLTRRGVGYALESPPAGYGATARPCF